MPTVRRPVTVQYDVARSAVTVQKGFTYTVPTTCLFAKVKAFGRMGDTVTYLGEPYPIGQEFEVAPGAVITAEDSTVQLTLDQYTDGGTVDSEGQILSPAGQRSQIQSLVSEEVIVARTRTWATLGAPADYIGLAYVTDIGPRGSLWRSDGLAWGLVGGSCVLDRINTAGATLTGTTAETLAYTYSAPAGLLGPNGAIEFQAKFAFTNSANVKTLRLRIGGIGGTMLNAQSMTTNVTTGFSSRIENRNSESVQLGVNDTLSYGAATSNYRTAAVNTALATDFVLTMQHASAAENLTLEAVRVILYRP